MKKNIFISIENKIINRIFAGVIFIGILILALTIFVQVDPTFSGSATLWAFTESWEFFLESTNNIDNLNVSSFLIRLVFVHNHIVIAIWFSAILVISFIKCIISLTKGKDCGIISQFITAFALSFIHYFITYNFVHIQDINPLFYIIFIGSLLFIIGYAILAQIINKTFMKNMILIILLLIIIILTSIMVILFLGPIYAFGGSLYNIAGIKTIYNEQVITVYVNVISFIVTLFFIGLMSAYRGILKSLLRNELKGFNNDALSFVILSFFTIGNAFIVTTFITLAKYDWGIDNIINEFKATLSTRLIILYILPVLIIGLLIASAIVKGVLNSVRNNADNTPKTINEEKINTKKNVIEETNSEEIVIEEVTPEETIVEDKNDDTIEESITDEKSTEIIEPSIDEEETTIEEQIVDEPFIEDKIEESVDNSITETIETNEE